ncbi:MAG TPA: c-type cytochrome [Gemmatimonadaceae bacterium]
MNLRAAALVFAGICACTESSPVARDTARAAQSSDFASRSAPVAAPVRYRVPAESEITDSVTLASVRRGRALIHSTRDSLPKHVGNALNCANCHMADGTVANAMPLVGAYSRFPQYRARSGKVDLLEDRINDCFLRSMNGKALDRSSAEMRDMVAYIAFLSTGFPVGIDMEGQGIPKLDPLPGDTTSGKEIFAARCVACHGANGEGTAAAPPLWGPQSYNIGAGMARVRTAAAFIRQLMPRDRPLTLTPQQAFDLATYINSRPRPDFRGKEKDWPHGGQPPDVAYKTLSAKTSSSERPRTQ